MGHDVHVVHGVGTNGIRDIVFKKEYANELYNKISLDIETLKRRLETNEKALLEVHSLLN